MTSSPPKSGRLVFAFGDIHGRLDLLDVALAAVDAQKGDRDARLVFLGDYVDRGPESRGVVERLMALDSGQGVVCLKGNHEALMLDALSRPTAGRVELWLEQGGTETLASYGAATIEEGRERVPPEHLRWMAGLPVTSGDGRRVYVHAGLLPSTPMEAQDEETCLWIRDRFLKADASAFEAHVVHGHSTRWRGKPDDAEPERLGHRTNLDTGAYRTGILTVGVFDDAVAGGPVALIRTTDQGGRIRSEVTTCAPAETSAPKPAKRWSLFGRGRPAASP